MNIGKAMNIQNFSLAGLGVTSSRPTHEERFNRVMADLDALEHGGPEHSGIAWLFFWLKEKFDHFVHWCVDMYTGISFWLHSKYPRGYLIFFITFSIIGSGIYVYDIYLDFAVATGILASGLKTEFGVVLIFIVLHYLVISFMLGIKMYYHFEAKVIQFINRMTFPWDPKSHYSIHDTVQQQEVDAFLKSLTSSTVELSSTPQLNLNMVESTQNTLLLTLSWLVRAILKTLAFLLYCLVLLGITPFLDLSMMCLELLGGTMVVHAKSSHAKNMLAFQNFLLQYETIRVPARSYLESFPQTAYQGYLYAKLKNYKGLNLDLTTLAQSIALSILSGAKNTIEFSIAYKVSGFSFWSYVTNAVLFEGAATLPFRWNAKRSSMLDRLVLGGDFYTLAHAQKMKLFQAALQHRKSITITTDEAKALDEECVVVASSLTMLEFIANMLPVSLSEQLASSATIRIDITDIKTLPWRDDDRTISREQALKILFNMHESLMTFINVPMIWQKLEVVRMVNCDLPDFEEEVDFGGIGELLLRSRVKVLDMTHTHLGDTGLKALLFGLLENTSLVRLGLAGTGITAIGARQLLQGLTGHATLAELDVSLNHLKSDGAQHLGRLIVTLPALQQLHVAAIGMRADGFQALSMQASYAPHLRVLNMSANPDAFSTPEAMDLLVTLLMRAHHGLHLHVGHCKLDTARLESLCRGGMVGKRGLRGLGLSGDAISKQGVTAFCEALWSRVQRDRFALGLSELPSYVPYEPREHALQADALDYHRQRAYARMAADGPGRGLPLQVNPRGLSGQLSIHPSSAPPSGNLLADAKAARSSIRNVSPRWKRRLHGDPCYDSQGIEQDPDKVHSLLSDEPDHSNELDDAQLPVLPRGYKALRHKSLTFSKMADKLSELNGKFSHRLSSRLGNAQVAKREGSETSNPEAIQMMVSLGATGSTSIIQQRESMAMQAETDAEVEEEDEGRLQRPKKLQRTYLVLLELCDCGLQKVDVDELCYALSEAPGLEVLDLSRNSELGNDALCVVACLIGGPQQESMTKLRMVNCGLSARGLRMEGVSYALSRLMEVDLSYNPLGNEGVYELCMDVLSESPYNKLQVLGLGAVNMGKQGFNYLLDALSVNSSIQRLLLNNNFIGSFHPHLYELFQSRNKTLKLLDLRDNQLSYEWCTALAKLGEVGLHRVIQL